jgi:hypothetical protein
VGGGCTGVECTGAGGEERCQLVAVPLVLLLVVAGKAAGLDSSQLPAGRRQQAHTQ